MPLGRTLGEVGLTLAGALSAGAAAGVGLGVFIEAVDHLGLTGGRIAVALAPSSLSVLSVMLLSVIIGGSAIWCISRKLYRGASRWMRAAALLGVIALFGTNAVGIVFAHLGWVVCASTGTGCVRPTGPIVVMAIGMVGAVILGGWWLRIPGKSLYVSRTAS